MSNKLDTTAYFNDFYQDNDDPWGYQSRWYEERKRQICLSLLLKPHYQHVLEIGSANGCFSQSLAKRAHHLHCIDGNQKAVELTKKALENHSNVTVECKTIPLDFPQLQYDLIVLSEIAYYLTSAELVRLIVKLQSQLTAQGMLLSCHWRHPIEQFQLDGNRVHQSLKNNLNLHHYSSLVDPDFLVDLWTKDHRSLAKSEGIL